MSSEFIWIPINNLVFIVITNMLVIIVTLITIMVLAKLTLFWVYITRTDATKSCLWRMAAMSLQINPV